MGPVSIYLATFGGAPWDEDTVEDIGVRNMARGKGPASPLRWEFHCFDSHRIDT
jgi:hypothetical protein